MNKYKSQREFTYQDQYEHTQKIQDFKDLLTRIKDGELDLEGFGGLRSSVQSMASPGGARAAVVASANISQSSLDDIDLQSIDMLDKLRVTDSQRDILKDLDQIGKQKVNKQQEAFKTVFRAHPQRVKDLFGDKITEIKRKN